MPAGSGNRSGEKVRSQVYSVANQPVSTWITSQGIRCSRSRAATCSTSSWER